MEREILFRGKRPDGEWVKGSLVVQHTGGTYIFEPCGGNIIPVFSNTVGQYIWREDKAGQKIFEGDVVKVDYYSMISDKTTRYVSIGEVVYDTTLSCWSIRESSGAYLSLAHLLLRFNSYTLTKLGNVYDNPELLGGDTHE